MTIIKSNLLKKLILGSFVLLLFQINIFSFWAINYSQTIFNSNNSTTGPSANGSIYKSSGSSLENYIIQGAANFLDSYNYTLQYMKKTEAMPLEGVNPVELKELLTSALASMKQANESYVSLKNLADRTPYDLDKVIALKGFNYEKYLRNNSKYLNKELFKDVKSYLSDGDVRGIYRKMVSDTAQIIVILNRLISATESGAILCLEDTWKVNQLYSQFLLFGQYVAQIFENMSNTEY